MATNRQRIAPRSLRTLFHGGSLVGLTDGQLLERFAVREVQTAEAAFAAMIDRHGPMVFRTCLAVLRDEHEAHDAFQATFLTLMRKAGSLWVEDSLGPWLHRVACRAAARARRASARRRVAEQRAAERVRERTEVRAWDDREAIIHEEINRLPDRYRIPIVLCDLEGRPYEEAACHIGCPVGTVKSRLARGRGHLKERLIRRGLADPDAIRAPGFLVAGAGLPASLAGDTIRLAIAGMAAGSVPGSIAVPMVEALRAMIRKPLRSIISLLLAVSIIAVGWGVCRPGSNGPRAMGSPAGERPIGRAEDDLEAIQGAWIRESTNGVNEKMVIAMTVVKDRDQPREGLPPGAARFVFEWSAGGKVGTSQKVLLNPTRAPKTLDFLVDTPGAPSVCPGIYRLEDDTLTICFRAVGGAHPDGFAAIKPDEILDVYRREASGGSRPAEPGSPTAGRSPPMDPSRIEGNWIVRGSYGEALALLNIDVRGPRISLLPSNDPKVYRLPGSGVETPSIDDNSVRFVIRLVSDRNASGAVRAVDVYIPEGEARPAILRGSMAVSRSRFPVVLERTGSATLDREQAIASAPGSGELRRTDQVEDPEKRRRLLEGILERYGDRPIAPIAGWSLAIALADARATQVEVRSATERAIRLAARYGPELELAAVHRIANHLVETGLLPELALDYARKAEAMVQLSDPVALRRAILKDLSSALLSAGRPGEVKAVEERLWQLGRSGVPAARTRGPAVEETITIPGRRRSSPPPDPRPASGSAGPSSSARPASAGRATRGRIFAVVRSEPGEEPFQELVAIDPETAAWERLTEDGQPRPCPRVSPDGKSLAYSGLGRGGVFRCDIRGADPVQIASGTGVPVWSPDGKQVLVSEVIEPVPDARADFRWMTWCYPADGSGRVRLPLPEGGQVLDWSPAGNWLITRSGGMDRLTLIHPDGTGARDLARSGFTHSPRFSPDGRSLSYVSADGAGGSLWIAEVAGEGRHCLFRADGIDIDGPTCWSSDGKSLAAVLREPKPPAGVDRSAGARIEILDVTGAGRRALSLPRWRFVIADWR